MKTIIALLILCAAVPMNAQVDRVSGGAGHFRFGYANYDLSGMNRWLTSAYPVLKNNFVTFGGGGYAIVNDLIIGGEGFGANGSTVTKDTLSITPTLGAGMVNVGYVVYRTAGMFVYPLAGFGGGGQTYRFSELDGSGGIINRVKESSYEYTNGYLVLCGAVGIDKFFRFGERTSGPSLSLRIGYSYSLQNSNWKRRNAEVSGPEIDPSMFFITLGIGGGGWTTGPTVSAPKFREY